MIRCTRGSARTVKWFALVTVLLYVIVILPSIALSGCKKTVSTGKIRIVCTIFPQYDWVCRLLGDKADQMEVILLIDNSIDLHNYQPSVDDIVRISTCDLFIYVGGVSDNWVDGALKEAANKEMIIINLIDVLGDAAKIEAIIEGMEEENHYVEEHGDEHEDEAGNVEEIDYDEHVWLSLKNAQVLCPIIADALSSLDADNAAVYQNNLTAYLDKLSALDSKYQTAIAAAPIKIILVGDRFPFRYLADDYSLSYYAAFVGCSAETEASFDTIIFLAGKADEYGLKNIIVTESSDKKIAQTIIGNTKNKNYNILVMDSMQSVTISEIKSGTTYISVMESNLNALIEALQ